MATGYIGQYEDAGSKNAFYLIKDKKIGRKRIGFKEFESESEAKFAHKIQSILADKDLTPQVYGQVGMIRRHDGELSGYGYLTEIARTMPECYNDDCDGECFESGCHNSNVIAGVVDMLDFYGLCYNDHHRGNFGYVRRKNQWIPVVIDVGIESFSDWDAGIYGLFEGDGDEYDNTGCNCTMCRK